MNIQNIKEFAKLYNDYGYHLSAWPRYLGKHIVSLRIPKWYDYSYPWYHINENMNIGINHKLSKTCCLDIDEINMSTILFDYLGIDIQDLKNSTMSWKGRDRGFKCLFKKPKETLDWFNYKSIDNKSVFELRAGSDNDIRGVGSIVSVYDVAPPSVVGSVHYTYITDILRYEELPNLPTKLVEIWSEQEEFKSKRLV